MILLTIIIISSFFGLGATMIIYSVISWNNSLSIKLDISKEDQEEIMESLKN
jgi:hypothetical protein